jgi:exopolysaccharide biosynthesis polyprenyl glycosylphosphotransferase
MLFSPSPRKRRLQLRIPERRRLIMLGDVIAVAIAVLIALAVWSRVARDEFSVLFVLEQVYWFVILIFLWLVLAGANDFYELPIAASRLVSFQKLVTITGQLLVVYLIIFFLSPRDALPRLFILYYGIASFICIGVWRFMNPAFIGWASAPRHVLIIGTDWGAKAIIEAIASQTERAYVVCGIIGETKHVGQMVANAPVIGTSSDLMNFVRRDQISELVLTSTHDLSGEMFQAVMDAYEKGVELVPMPLLYERITGRVPVEYVASNWSVVLPINSDSIFYPYPLLKRFGEVTLALIGMIFFVLLLPFLALVIKSDSRGSIFYTQERVGLNGRIFRVYKLRTMIEDAESMTGAVFSQAGDPRVTRSGRFMRKTRLDEMPQLINILRGDMSLIGPRPERPEHIKRLTEKIPFYRTRLVIRPGLTGWAQVRYDYGSTDEDALVKLQYDLYYIRHQSLWLDLNILVRTVGRVLKMSGV